MQCSLRLSTVTHVIIITHINRCYLCKLGSLCYKIVLVRMKIKKIKVQKIKKKTIFSRKLSRLKENFYFFEKIREHKLQ